MSSLACLAEPKGQNAAAALVINFYLTSLIAANVAVKRNEGRFWTYAACERAVYGVFAPRSADTQSFVPLSYISVLFFPMAPNVRDPHSLF